MRITAIKETKDYTIEAVQLDDGSVHSLEDAIQMAKNGQIEGVSVAESKNGSATLRSTPDGDPSNNLKNLPRIQ